MKYSNQGCSHTLRRSWIKINFYFDLCSCQHKIQTFQHMLLLYIWCMMQLMPRAKHINRCSHPSSFILAKVSLNTTNLEIKTCSFVFSFGYNTTFIMSAVYLAIMVSLTKSFSFWNSCLASLYFCWCNRKPLHISHVCLSSSLCTNFFLMNLLLVTFIRRWLR